MALLRALVAGFSTFLASGPSSAASLQIQEDWTKSPEAYFLTVEEKREWEKLAFGDARRDFIERYWLKRDPSPGTARNEFRELVFGRIRTADARYRIDKTPGSRTAQGFVFIVFGTPARVQERHASPPPPPRRLAPGERDTPVGFAEGTEVAYTWLYERERTPEILDAIGKPSLAIEIVTEPHRRRDQLQKPGLVNEFRERIAARSIINADLVPPRDAASETAPDIPIYLRNDPLPARIRSLLENAPPANRAENGTVFGSAVIWNASGDAEAFVWFFLPRPKAGAGEMTFQALIRSEDGGQDVTTVSGPAVPSSVLPSADWGRVVLRRFSLPAGGYSGAFALLSGSEVVHSTSVRLRVPDLDDGFSVSTPLLAARIIPASRPEGAFIFGKAQVLPRADATFSSSESLWYFVEVVNPSDPCRVTQSLVLRRRNETVASRSASTAELEQLSPGRYAFGYELSLSDLEPGDYVLYLSVHGAEESSRQVRRAEFRVIKAP